MFDVGWSEMAVIALVALVVLGPKELPQAMKTFAAFTRKMQRYARDFRSGVDNIIREAELEDAKKALDAARVNPKTAVQKLVDPTGETTAAVGEIEKIARDKGGVAGAVAGVATVAGGSGPASAAPTPASSAPASPAPAAPEPAAPAPAPAAEAPSNVIVQPTNMAPPHSIRPPAAPSPEPVPVPAARPSDKGEPPAGGTPT